MSKKKRHHRPRRRPRKAGYYIDDFGVLWRGPAPPGKSWLRFDGWTDADAFTGRRLQRWVLGDGKGRRTWSRIDPARAAKIIADYLTVF